jgi:hypothetical protein
VRRVRLRIWSAVGGVGQREGKEPDDWTRLWGLFYFVGFDRCFNSRLQTGWAMENAFVGSDNILEGCGGIFWEAMAGSSSGTFDGPVRERDGEAIWGG